MTKTFDISHTKQSVTLSISEDLVTAARHKNIDLSAALESYLCSQLGHNYGPDFCESYASEVSTRKVEANNLMQYCKDHGQF